MAYKVLYGSSTIYEPDADYGIHKAKLGQQTNKVSTFSFTMPPGHPLYNTVKVRDLANPVEVRFGGKRLFDGYISTITVGIDLQKEIECVSHLQLLDEVYIRLADHDKISEGRDAMKPNLLFLRVIDLYNQAMDNANAPNAKFVSGNYPTDAQMAGYGVGYPATDDAGETQMVVSINATAVDTALSILDRALISPYGCTLKTQYDEEDGLTHIGLYVGAWAESDQTIEFGENMTKYSYETTDDDFYTACYPIGGTTREYSGTTVATFKLAAATAHRDSSVKIKTTNGTRKVSSGDVIKIQGIGYNIDTTDSSREVTVTTSGVTVNVTPPVQRASAVNQDVQYLGASPKYTDYVCDLTHMDNRDKVDSWLGRTYRKRGAIVFDVELARRYGLKTMTITDSDITYAPNLMNKAISEIRKKRYFAKTLEVDAVDMALYRNDKGHLLAGQNVHVHSAPHGTDEDMQVISANLDLDNPGATRYTLGKRPRMLTRRLRGLHVKDSETMEVLVGALNNNITWEQVRALK